MEQTFEEQFPSLKGRIVGIIYDPGGDCRMTELKTLKDMYDVSDFVSQRNMKNPDDAKSGAMIYVRDLRQEAIKWIKSIEKQDNDSFPKFCCCDDDNGWHETTMDWIKHFFNITEEELNG